MTLATLQSLPPLPATARTSVSLRIQNPDNFCNIIREGRVCVLDGPVHDHLNHLNPLFKISYQEGFDNKTIVGRLFSQLAPPSRFSSQISGNMSGEHHFQIPKNSHFSIEVRLPGADEPFFVEERRADMKAMTIALKFIKSREGSMVHYEKMCWDHKGEEQNTERLELYNFSARVDIKRV